MLNTFQSAQYVYWVDNMTVRLCISQHNWHKKSCLYTLCLSALLCDAIGCKRKYNAQNLMYWLIWCCHWYCYWWQYFIYHANIHAMHTTLLQRSTIFVVITCKCEQHFFHSLLLAICVNMYVFLQFSWKISISYGLSLYVLFASHKSIKIHSCMQFHIFCYTNNITRICYHKNY